MMAIKILGAIAAVAAVAVVTAGLLMYFRVIPIPGPILGLLLGLKEPEHSARYYPPDTLAYAWVTLAPGGGQLEDMQDIWSRFNEFREFRRFVDELREDFEDDTGIDFEMEVMPWIGPDASVAFIDYDARRDVVLIAATIEVRDGDAARDFLDAWLNYMEYEEGADFDSDAYKDFKIWADESEYQVYGLSDDLLVFATTESGIREMIDGIVGDTERSLAENENFKAARAALPGRRFASVYVDLQEAVDQVEYFYPDEFGMGLAGSPNYQDSEWVAASAAWFDRAIVVDTVIPLGIDYPLKVANLAEPARLAPDDALAFIAGNFDADLDNWRKAMDSYDLVDYLTDAGYGVEYIEEINRAIAEIANGDPPELNRRDSLADVIDLVIWLIDDLTGIRADKELLDHLTGEAIVAVGDVDFARVEEDPMTNAVDLYAMIAYREGSKNGLSDTMDEIVDLVEQEVGLFVEVDTVDVGASDDAVLFDIGGELVQTDYAPGYVLHEGYMTVGTTKYALETAVAMQQGDETSLSSVDEYNRVIGYLPAERQSLAYVNLQRIIRQIDPYDLDLTKDEFEILQESIGVAAVSSYSPHCLESSADDSCPIPENEDGTRITAVLTLFPE